MLGRFSFTLIICFFGYAAVGHAWQSGSRGSAAGGGSGSRAPVQQNFSGGPVPSGVPQQPAPVFNSPTPFNSAPANPSPQFSNQPAFSGQTVLEGQPEFNSFGVQQNFSDTGGALNVQGSSSNFQGGIPQSIPQPNPPFNNNTSGSPNAAGTPQSGGGPGSLGIPASSLVDPIFQNQRNGFRVVQIEPEC